MLLTTMAFDDRNRHRVPRAPLLLLLSGLLLPPHAAAAEKPVTVPWRSVHAPAEVSALLAFANQPPGDEGDNGGQEDSVPKEITPPPNPNPTPSGSGTPGFNQLDTSKVSNKAFPGGNEAPLETLGAGSNRPFQGGAPTALPTGPKLRRGLFGLHPMFLLVGLIAIHIFVVTTVVK
jgi:hypothetical protein